MTDDSLPRPTGWLAQLPPEAQKELMEHLLAIQASKQVMNDAATVTIMELRGADALDASAFAETMRSSAAAARRQAQVLEGHAREYDAMADLIARHT